MNKQMLLEALKNAFTKLSFKKQIKNPVMFCVYVVSIITFILFICSLFNIKDASLSSGYILLISILLFFTVIFANFAEAIAESKGKAQADSLRKSRKNVIAHKIKSIETKDHVVDVDSASLKINDLVIVRAGEVIPSDGQVVYGAASVDESSITGESASVIRESGGDKDSVSGGTSVLSDEIIIRISANPGESLMDKMIELVEGSKRKKTPNEIALEILLNALTIIFILVSVSLYCYSLFRERESATNTSYVLPVTYLVSLFVCLAPTTIGALLSAIGISGMARLNKVNVIAKSGRAIEAAGDVDVLLLDKTGTITYGNRRANEIIALSNTDQRELLEASYVSSLKDDTLEGKSILEFIEEKYQFNHQEMLDKYQDASFIEFSAKTRMSGVDLGSEVIRKGSIDAIKKHAINSNEDEILEAEEITQEIAKKGGTPLLVSKNYKILGVIYLKDIVKEGIREKFEELRKAGIKTIMITGDNPLTAASIAHEANVDDFLAEATPLAKMELISKYQSEGHLVAMSGDGTNDAPALAKADVAVAMNSGTQAAKDACNMVDLDSSPTKLIEIVRIGKQLLMTRGTLTTFSIANDISKYFAIIPAMFPSLAFLNIMKLNSPQSAILSAVIYNALIIIFLIPLALKGVKYKERSASKTLAINLLIYGLGGLIVPFIFIKLIDLGVGLFI